MGQMVVDGFEKLGWLGGIVCVAITVLFFWTVYIHNHVHKGLINIHSKLEQGFFQFNLMEDIVSGFKRNKTKDSFKIETYIQKYFSSFKLPGKKATVLSQIKQVQSTVSIFILLGVLGTFIGLTQAIKNINLESPDHLFESVSVVLSGLDTAFITSIFGMAASLIMTLLLRKRDTENLLTDIMLRVENYLEAENETAADHLLVQMGDLKQSIEQMDQNNSALLKELVAPLVEMKSSLKNLTLFSEGFNKAAVSLEAFNEGLGENVKQFNDLFTSMKEVTSGFDKGVTTLNENFGSLFQYLNDTNDRQEAFIKTYEETYRNFEQGIAEQREFHTELKETWEQQVEEIKELNAEQKKFSARVINTQNEISEGLTQFLQESNNKQAVLIDGLNEVHEQTMVVNDQIDARLNVIEGIFGQEWHESLLGIKNSLDGNLQSLSHQFASLSDEMMRNQNNLGDLAQNMVHLTEVQSESQIALDNQVSALQNIYNNIQELTQHITDTVEHHRESVAQISESQMQVAAGLMEVDGKNAHLLQGIQGSIEAMSQRESQLENNVELLKDAFEEQISLMNKNMVAELKTLLEKMGKYVDLTNKIIDSRFSQLRASSEAFQEGSIIHIQQSIKGLENEVLQMNRVVTQFVKSSSQMVQSVGKGI